MSRWASLAVELCLAAANVVAFGALLARGTRAGRVAHAALVWGASAGLAAALLTLLLRTDAVWLMGAWRADPAAQLVKALVLAGLLATVRVSRRGSPDWRTERATGPMFRLACGTGLVAAASAGDLLGTWVGLDIATVALILEVATAGRWSQREDTVRRMAAGWLPASLALLLGIILLAAIGGSTRYDRLETTLPEYGGSPAVVTGIVLIAASILVRALRLVSLLGTARRRG